MRTGEVTLITLSQHHVCLLLGLAIYLGRTHGYILQVVQVPPIFTQALKVLYAYWVLHNLPYLSFYRANIMFLWQIRKYERETGNKREQNIRVVVISHAKSAENAENISLKQ